MFYQACLTQLSWHIKLTIVPNISLSSISEVSHSNSAVFSTSAIILFPQVCPNLYNPNLKGRNWTGTNWYQYIHFTIIIYLTSVPFSLDPFPHPTHHQYQALSFMARTIQQYLCSLSAIFNQHKTKFRTSRRGTGLRCRSVLVSNLLKAFLSHFDKQTPQCAKPFLL